MYSLFYVATDQHGDEFVPVRCNKETISRLIRYFEDVVIENKLSALVVEGRCLDGEGPKESERLGRLLSVSRHAYLFSCGRECESRTWRVGKARNVTAIEERDFHSIETGPFILVMDQRFCGMLASYSRGDGDAQSKDSFEMIWTFDPNVVFTAAEYLMARISAQRKEERQRFEALLKVSTPRTSSLRIALSLTTKLATLMQRQNERAAAINTISAAISSTLDTDELAQAAVGEVGRALKARRAALVLWAEGSNLPEGMNVYEREDPHSDNRVNPTRDLQDEHSVIPGPLEFPVTYTGSRIGVLSVEDDTPGRTWEDEEILMVRTVSDQLAVAISHARLFEKMKTQAITDPLTGLFNHRRFQQSLEHQMKVADRNGDPLSLILLDLDHLKRVNDTHGHRAGDSCLVHVAKSMREAVREIDICARYGGEEFVIILPKCDCYGARGVAERVKDAIARTQVEGVGTVTASVGVASYPDMAKSREELIEMADRAMYLAKAQGRNQVRMLPWPAPAPQVDLANGSIRAD
ncbi:MAG TPA: sensor domain-containing diguanylate cyclase [Blastocatellia bacterium]|nr:sensor domain-containing diguanylate cyclase [Blastocatellia bacterium]